MTKLDTTQSNLPPSDRDDPQPAAGELRNTDLQRLLDLVQRLRAPDGCPWDREQNLPDVRAYLIEEAHEAAAAVDSGDWQEIAGELGDLLFQVAFVCRLAEEEEAFATGEVLQGILDKMVARHPHVFAPEELPEELADAEAVRGAWEKRKARQRGPGTSILAGVPTSLPALTAAYRISQKAAGVGFDWPDIAGVLEKMDEERDELREALEELREDRADAKEHVRQEIGDLLFSVTNLARKLDLDPEAALAATNAKFRRRFARVEQGLEERGRSFDTTDLEEMEELWQGAKGEE
ncbi:MAG: nucleoside triphosphate pyrophosphohydrolase [Acidobacteriota bacterium]|nr:nucleoside triphosphate pyrophosphohydrolase [Acidobacteriota bacterium]